ncbi:MAG: PhoH family protein [Bacilli bacterium]|nr:PhoH family protein [Bacilli bacterium]MDY6430220.1 PhoH family protein [Bacilli bacterium]
MAESNPYKLFGIDFSANPEQKELLRLMFLDPKIMPVVYCKGDAGTGKTFTALAGALSMVRGRSAYRQYKEIYYVREPVEVGHRLGYLKGTAEEKYGPYLGALIDNYHHLMDNIKNSTSALDKTLSHPKREKRAGNEVVLQPSYEDLPFDIVPLAPEFIRGRSFEDCVILVDEAQNLNIDEIQTLVTRIGPCTKMVIMGSPNQIDVSDQTFEHNDFMISYSLLESSGLVGYVELIKSMRSSFVAEFDRRFVEYKKTLKKINK